MPFAPFVASTRLVFRVKLATSKGVARSYRVGKLVLEAFHESEPLADSRLSEPCGLECAPLLKASSQKRLTQLQSSVPQLVPWLVHCRVQHRSNSDQVTRPRVPTPMSAMFISFAGFCSSLVLTCPLGALPHIAVGQWLFWGLDVILF